MKRLTTILLLITSTALVFGQSDSLQKIQQVKKEVKKIDEELSEVAVITKYDTTHLQEKVEVYIHDNHIKKIKVIKSIPLIQDSFEFYFKWEHLIYLKELSVSEVFNTMKKTREYFVEPNLLIQQDGFYDGFKWIYEDYLIIDEKDTLHRGMAMQHEAYQYLDKYKHLLNYNPYKTLTYDSVVAYDFDGSGGGMIAHKNRLDRTAKNATRFSAKQIDSMLTFLSDTTTFGTLPPACFDPHFGVVFYHKGKIVSTINICFGCNYLIADKYLPSESHNRRRWEYNNSIMLIPSHGFSEEGKRRFKWLCSDLGLEYCPDGAAYENIIISKPNK